MMNSKYIMVILFFSITINLLVFSLDTIPFLWPKVENKFSNENSILIDENTEEIILNHSLKMIDSKNQNVWSDPKGFTETVYSIYSKNPNKEFKVFNYPKAYLYYGLSSYLIKNYDSTNLKKVKLSFDKLISADGEPTFNLDKVDQIPFGLTALNLHKVYGDDKYLKFCDILYSKIKSLKNKEDVVLYRQSLSVQFNDVLGMIVPFLVDYSEYVNQPEALLIAKKQLEFYVKYGVDKETYLPTHGIDLQTNIKVGPTNWGRGIGWYILGISFYNRATGEFEKEYNELIRTLNKLRTDEGLWSQFPGSSNNFDASATTMFLFSMNQESAQLSKKESIKSLFKYVTQEGYITKTSGDTYYINDYSKSFGRSELSQGFLLLLL